MMRSAILLGVSLVVAAALAGSGSMPASAQTLLAQASPAAGQPARAPAGAAAARGQRTDPFAGFAGNNRDPIRIDAARLEVFEKEQKAVYSGDVVAVRGTTVIRAPEMTIFFDSKRQNEQGGQRPAAASAPSAPGQDGALKRIEFKGPVRVVNGNQTATANAMIYDALAKRVTLRGDAVVTDGPNVQRGELMVYNTESGQAEITNPGGRVQGVFTPGGGESDGARRPRTGQTPTN